MKLVSEFRDIDRVKDLVERIRTEVKPGETYRIMEVCGSHTMAISRFGLRTLLPDNVELVSGPGCPVCVTAQGEIDAVFELIDANDVTVATFGDMLKVPGSSRRNLSDYKAAGADVRIVFSPLDVLKMAEDAHRPVVFIGIGFETTAPTVAGLVRQAAALNAENVSVFPMNKTMPEVLGVLLSDAELNLTGFLCPGHVTAVTGISLYDPVVDAGRAAVITGFEPVDILMSILEIVRQKNRGHYEVRNLYSRVVRDEGNAKARALMDEVFVKSDALWRGIGVIPGSGLTLAPKYERFNALHRFELTVSDAAEIPGCRCGDVLKGHIKPNDCGLFANTCTPENPVGPCMVSTEGACAAYHRYAL